MIAYNFKKLWIIKNPPKRNVGSDGVSDQVNPLRLPLLHKIQTKLQLQLNLLFQIVSSVGGVPSSLWTDVVRMFQANELNSAVLSSVRVFPEQLVAKFFVTPVIARVAWKFFKKLIMILVYFKTYKIFLKNIIKTSKKS